jgi:type IV fimbrial biogenesis protein FimT
MHWHKNSGLLVMAKNRAIVRGFTLIELMVTIALVVILMAIATPSFITYQRNSELTAFSNTMVASINAARGEAMKRGRYAMLVPANGTDWSSGWIVFVDMDRSQDYLSTADVTLLTLAEPPNYLTLTGNGTVTASPPYVMFDASGYSKTKAGGFGASTFEVRRNDVSGADIYAQTRRIKIASTGRVRVCTPTSNSDANCSATGLL